MSTAKDQSPLAWAVATRDVSKQGLAHERQATAAERAALAAALDLPQVEALSANYEITPLSRDRYRLKGRVEATLSQRCVVTLEPVEALVQNSFDIEFRPRDAVPGPAVRDDDDAVSGPDIEQIENGMIAVGRIVFETLACALDPYPRKSGAALDWQEPALSGEPSEPNPLSALKQPGQG